uniref:EngB-type G domain-containing protein n=1 Tax=Chromera velia CCMP2878 TaxID=1169474 RepID=A0A0G4GDX7_9ALVE|eukprot:Cvel_21450.t1-p1 / transcript=Cvel_21450.t1 / gene=Cvel_21450 / organism=Chromera_velia_CCMP2878 / gene_product=Probable GTP-binding protein EngB, putative / transcript_product=Probable GTP-binding protein EngB, putative / location=Cvel_scaffold2012:19554-34384(+) / protein_length=2221 / sequence_SO=supercontig / SO=protein_coding / is_pseudo=false
MLLRHFLRGVLLLLLCVVEVYAFLFKQHVLHVPGRGLGRVTENGASPVRSKRGTYSASSVLCAKKKKKRRGGGKEGEGRETETELTEEEMKDLEERFSRTVLPGVSSKDPFLKWNAELIAYLTEKEEKADRFRKLQQPTFEDPEKSTNPFEETVEEEAMPEPEKKRDSWSPWSSQAEIKENIDLEEDKDDDEEQGEKRKKWREVAAGEADLRSLCKFTKQSGLEIEDLAPESERGGGDAVIPPPPGYESWEQWGEWSDYGGERRRRDRERRNQMLGLEDEEQKKRREAEEQREIDLAVEKVSQQMERRRALLEKQRQLEEMEGILEEENEEAKEDTETKRTTTYEEEEDDEDQAESISEDWIKAFREVGAEAEGEVDIPEGLLFHRSSSSSSPSSSVEEEEEEGGLLEEGEDFGVDDETGELFFLSNGTVFEPADHIELSYYDPEGNLRAVTGKEWRQMIAEIKEAEAEAEGENEEEEMEVDASLYEGLDDRGGGEHGLPPLKVPLGDGSQMHKGEMVEPVEHEILFLQYGPLSAKTGLSGPASPSLSPSTRSPPSSRLWGSAKQKKRYKDRKKKKQEKDKGREAKMKSRQSQKEPRRPMDPMGGLGGLYPSFLNDGEEEGTVEVEAQKGRGRERSPEEIERRQRLSDWSGPVGESFRESGVGSFMKKKLELMHQQARTPEEKATVARLEASLVGGLEDNLGGGKEGDDAASRLMGMGDFEQLEPEEALKRAREAVDAEEANRLMEENNPWKQGFFQTAEVEREQRKAAEIDDAKTFQTRKKMRDMGMDPRLPSGQNTPAALRGKDVRDLSFDEMTGLLKAIGYDSSTVEGATHLREDLDNDEDKVMLRLQEYLGFENPEPLKLYDPKTYPFEGEDGPLYSGVTGEKIDTTPDHNAEVDENGIPLYTGPIDLTPQQLIDLGYTERHVRQLAITKYMGDNPDMFEALDWNLADLMRLGFPKEHMQRLGVDPDLHKLPPEEFATAVQNLQRLMRTGPAMKESEEGEEEEEEEGDLDMMGLDRIPQSGDELLELQDRMKSIREDADKSLEMLEKTDIMQMGRKRLIQFKEVFDRMEMDATKRLAHVDKNPEEALEYLEKFTAKKAPGTAQLVKTLRQELPNIPGLEEDGEGTRITVEGLKKMLGANLPPGTFEAMPELESALHEMRSRVKNVFGTEKLEQIPQDKLDEMCEEMVEKVNRQEAKKSGKLAQEAFDATLAAEEQKMIDSVVEMKSPDPQMVEQIEQKQFEKLGSPEEWAKAIQELDDPMENPLPERRFLSPEEMGGAKDFDEFLRGVNLPDELGDEQMDPEQMAEILAQTGKEKDQGKLMDGFFGGPTNLTPEQEAEAASLDPSVVSYLVAKSLKRLHKLKSDPEGRFFEGEEGGAEEEDEEEDGMSLFSDSRESRRREEAGGLFETKNELLQSRGGTTGSIDADETSAGGGFKGALQEALNLATLVVTPDSIRKKTDDFNIAADPGKMKEVLKTSPQMLAIRRQMWKRLGMDEELRKDVVAHGDLSQYEDTDPMALLESGVARVIDGKSHREVKVKFLKDLEREAREGVAALWVEVQGEEIEEARWTPQTTQRKEDDWEDADEEDENEENEEEEEDELDAEAFAAKQQATYVAELLRGLASNNQTTLWEDTAKRFLVDSKPQTGGSREALAIEELSWMKAAVSAVRMKRPELGAWLLLEREKAFGPGSDEEGEKEWSDVKKKTYAVVAGALCRSESLWTEEAADPETARRLWTDLHGVTEEFDRLLLPRLFVGACLKRNSKLALDLLEGQIAAFEGPGKLESDDLRDMLRVCSRGRLPPDVPLFLVELMRRKTKEGVPSGKALTSLGRALVSEISFHSSHDAMKSLPRVPRSLSSSPSSSSLSSTLLSKGRKEESRAEDESPLLCTPEVVFMGRSNVGKSSLVNVCVARQSLASTSDRPGHTQSFNFYLANPAGDSKTNTRPEMFFVDVPGLGFATETGAGKIDSWRGLHQRYLSAREPLQVVFHLVDSRLGFTKHDLELLTFVERAKAERAEKGLRDFDYRPVLTKSDRLKTESKVRKSAASIKEVLKERGWRYESSPYESGAEEEKGSVVQPVVVTCSKKGQLTGRDQIWKCLRGAMKDAARVALYREEEEGVREGSDGTVDALSVSSWPDGQESGHWIAPDLSQQKEMEARRKAKAEMLEGLNEESVEIGGSAGLSEPIFVREDRTGRREGKRGEGFLNEDEVKVKERQKSD